VLLFAAFATPEATTPMVILQLVDNNGRNSFSPAGGKASEHMIVRDLQLENGQIATTFHPR
jgi:hypothetical protein